MSIAQQNKYHFIPVLNQDGLDFIEAKFPKNEKDNQKAQMELQRKNMNNAA